MSVEPAPDRAVTTGTADVPGHVADQAAASGPFAPVGVVHRVRHLTRYSYPKQATLGHNLARLTPRHTHLQRVRSSQLIIEPAPDERSSHQDSFGNTATYFSVAVGHESLTVVAKSEVEVAPPPEIGEPAATRPWEASVVTDSWAHAAPAAERGGGPSTAPDAERGGDPSTAPDAERSAGSGTAPAPDPAADLGSGSDATTSPGDEGERSRWVEFALPSPLVPPLEALADYARPLFPPGRSGPEAVLDLMERIYEQTSFDPHVTSVATPLSEVIEHRRGVCQDFAHLAVGCLRSMGLAARYVSGYLETLPPPGKPKLVGADASHAWCSVWLSGYGWLDMDPTNGHVPHERHVTVGWGRDYGDVTPLKGVVFGAGGAQALTVEVDVERL